MMNHPQDATGTLRTFTGRLYQPLNIDPALIDIRDIAHALAQTCRFAGHTRMFFSVAQHSVLVSRRAGAIDDQAALWGLLHDASEAYLVDVPSPLKETVVFTPYRDAERVLQTAIFEVFGCFGPVPAAVHVADEDQLAIEFRDLMPGLVGDRWTQEARGAAPLVPMSPVEAEAAFLGRFLELRRTW